MTNLVRIEQAARSLFASNSMVTRSACCNATAVSGVSMGCGLRKAASTDGTRSPGLAAKSKPN